MDLTLSNRGDYVVRSAICLARAYGSGQPRKLRQVSAEMEVPRTFVSQILGDLVRAELAVSSFGKDGGYRLARPPGQVSLLQVIEAGEGSLVPEPCPAAAQPCHWREICPVYDSWAAAAGALRAVLASTSLASVAERDRVIDDGSSPIPADPPPPPARAVTVADSVHVELSAPVVVARLRDGGSWLVPHLQQAVVEGEDRGASRTEQLGDPIRVRIGPGERKWLGKTVAVHLGPVRGECEQALVIPLTWQATGPSRLFPRLDAELRVVGLDEERAELSLSGRYYPPLGRAGQVLDEALLARVARATVRAFLRRVARCLEEEGSAAGGLAEDGHGERRVAAEGA